MRIFPTITTIHSDWEKKIQETRQKTIKEVAFFFTALTKKERERAYFLIQESPIERIPFAHIRSDMSTKELDFLREKYGTEVFNTHGTYQYPLHYDYSSYAKSIFIENGNNSLSEKDLKEFGGICLDFSHIENKRLKNDNSYEKELKLLEEYPVGCNHISAIKENIFKDPTGEWRYDSHYFEYFSEFDYLKKYPLRFFSKYIALELTNELSEQLKAIEYIKGVIRKNQDYS